jgi:toxin FitB
LLDSNIVIYATKPEFSLLDKILARKDFAVSIVSFVEVLGFHKITEEDKIELETFFDAAQTFPVSEEIARKAVELRQLRKISLGDSLIAATALIEECTLVTKNTRDFKWIEDLDLIDPFETKN